MAFGLKDDDRRGSALLIVRKLRGGQEDVREAATNSDGDEVDSSMGLKAAAEEMMEAFSRGDSEQLQTSLKSFIQMVMSESPDDEQEA